MVEVIIYLQSSYVTADRYSGGPSQPWKYLGRTHYDYYSLDGDYDEIPYEGMTPMSDLEKEAYQFAEMTKEERKLHGGFAWRDYVPPPGVGDDASVGVAYGGLGAFLGIGGIVVALMMMQ